MDILFSAYAVSGIDELNWEHHWILPKAISLYINHDDTFYAIEYGYSPYDNHCLIRGNTIYASLTSGMLDFHQYITPFFVCNLHACSFSVIFYCFVLKQPSYIWTLVRRQAMNFRQGTKSMRSRLEMRKWPLKFCGKY